MRRQGRVVVCRSLSQRRDHALDIGGAGHLPGRARDRDGVFGVKPEHHNSALADELPALSVPSSRIEIAVAPLAVRYVRAARSVMLRPLFRINSAATCRIAFSGVNSPLSTCFVNAGAYRATNAILRARSRLMMTEGQSHGPVAYLGPAAPSSPGYYTLASARRHLPPVDMIIL
jgi:hypothetical protein